MEGIAKLQSALADGPDVELMRLKQMCDVWRLRWDDIDDRRRKSLATQFEIKLYSLAGDELKHDSDYLKKLEHGKKLEICRGLSEYLCAELRRAPIDHNVVAETINQSVTALSYREALIYRDWQDAIGDAMLEPDPDSVRRFKIVGYERFEEILKGKSLWLEVFRDSIVDIDFDRVDPNDFRAKQLKGVATSVADIVVSLVNGGEGDLLSEDVLKVANELLCIAEKDANRTG